MEDEKKIEVILSRQSQRENIFKILYEMEMNNNFDFTKWITIGKENYNLNEKVKKSDIENSEHGDNIKSILKENQKRNEELLSSLDSEDVLEYSVKDGKDDELISLDEIENKEEMEYIINAIKYFEANKEDIDNTISKILKKGWSINRISKIDLCILRLCITEIKFLKIPYKVAINESINIAKEYSTEQSPKFINGVLKDYIKINNLDSSIK